MFYKFGYKKHFLLVYFLHLVHFIRSCSTMESFPFFLTALFTVGLGFFNSANCNPLAIKMGSPTGAHRLTLAGG
jgi:FHS family L-fucose permease-like MFS transporter